MTHWTWAYSAATGAVFGYWQNNVAAGVLLPHPVGSPRPLCYPVCSGTLDPRAKFENLRSHKKRFSCR